MIDHVSIKGITESLLFQDRSALNNGLTGLTDQSWTPSLC